MRVCIAYMQMPGLAMVSSGRQETRERAFNVSFQAQLSCLNSLLHIVFYMGDISDGEREAGRKDAAARTVITCGW